MKRFVPVVFAILIASCETPSRQPYTWISPPKPGEQPLKPGTIGYLDAAPEAFLLTSEYESMAARANELALARDDIGMAEMAKQGRAFYLPGETRLRVLTNGRRRWIAECRILSGPHKDQIAWVWRSMIAKGEPVSRWAEQPGEPSPGTRAR